MQVNIRSVSFLETKFEYVILETVERERERICGHDKFFALHIFCICFTKICGNGKPEREPTVQHGFV
jgi:hypothetical protein